GIVSNYVPAQQMADGFVTFGNVQVAADGTVIYGDGHQVQGVVTSGDVQQTQAVVIQGNVPQVQEAVYAPPQYSQAVQTPYGVVQMQPETITQMPMPVQQQMITQMPQRPEMITQMPQKMEAITGLPQPVIIQPVAAQ